MRIGTGRILIGMVGMHGSDASMLDGKHCERCLGILSLRLGS